MKLEKGYCAIDATESKVGLFFTLLYCSGILLCIDEFGIALIYISSTEAQSLYFVIFVSIVSILFIGAASWMFAYVFWRVGTDLFDEYKLERKKGKLVIFYFWQAFLIAYFANRFTSTFYTDKDFGIFCRIYYGILTIFSVFGLLTSVTHCFDSWNSYQNHDIKYRQITDCPVTLDDETQTFSVTCKQGVIVLPVAWLAPIKMQKDKCSLYVYFRHPDTPFIQYHMFTFDSEGQANLAEQTIEWKM